MRREYINAIKLSVETCSEIPDVDTLAAKLWSKNILVKNEVDSIAKAPTCLKKWMVS
jgi:hypothetical protein